jgi:Mlc titration factor MtfA (ptsG expression regulator)
MGWFSAWRRARVLRRSSLDDALWRATVERYPFVRVLTDAERLRLRNHVLLFLHEKSVQAAGGLEMRDEMRMSIAVQACILILNLGLDYYDGWVEVIVYPDEFVASYEFVDEAGVAHNVREAMAGESWSRGPVIVSWADVEGTDFGGYNVVIHEFAHKLDMLNGDANGFPPLHADMDREAWSGAFGAAYERFCDLVDRGRHTVIDPYAAESPAEFFAVVSEAFFEMPEEVQSLSPEVYDQLRLFYRQDPGARLRTASRRAATLWA